MDLKKVYDKALEKTYVDGLKYDKEIVKDYDMFTKVEIENDYRHFGMLFAINLFNNMERMLNKSRKENK